MKSLWLERVFKSYDPLKYTSKLRGFPFNLQTDKGGHFIESKFKTLTPQNGVPC